MPPAPGLPPRADARNGGRKSSPSTIYRWGLGGLRRHDLNMEPGRKVGYIQAGKMPPSGRPRRYPPAGATPRSRPRGGRVPRPGRWTHRRGRPGRTLGLPAHAAAPPPSRFPAPALPARGEADLGRRGGRAACYLGAGRTRCVFRAVLHRQRRRFSDEAAIAALLGEGLATRLFLLRPRRSDQKGAMSATTTSRLGSCCPRALESLDRPPLADRALAMPHANSEPAARSRLRDARARLQGDAE